MTKSHKRRRPRLLRGVLTLLWAGAIAAGSLLRAVPAADRIVPVSHADLILHALLYGTLALLIASLMQTGTRGLVSAAGVAFAFGLLLECTQPFTGRTFDLSDLAANAAGVVLGVAIAAVVLGHDTGAPTDAAPPN